MSFNKNKKQKRTINHLTHKKMVSKKHLRLLGNISAATLLVFTVACGPSLTLTGVEYAQPMESVMTPDANGNVEDPRMGISFDVTPLNVKERGEGASLPAEVRLIRSSDGYYFVTAPGFRNVYVFKAKESAMDLEETIRVSSTGLANPAFNQRSPHIQLVDEGIDYRLTINGIVN
ncbi:hypothetical protein QA596_00415 [Balneolales bacterium ANBcel1]|nr:hypothetical protein [Balneolales bacterium ANBcel1]